MRRFFAAFALSIALAVCLAPSFAFASSEDILSGGKTLLDTQMTEGEGWIDVVNGPTFEGPSCDITIWAEPFAGLFGGTQYSYYVRFRIYKSDAVFTKSEDIAVDLSDTTNPEYTFSARSSGSYTAVAYFVTKSQNKFTGAMQTLSTKEIARESFTVTGSDKGETADTSKATKAANKLAKTKVTKTLKAKSLKKKAKTITLPKAKFGKVSWKVSKNKTKKALTLTKAGKVKVKKGTKAGTYTIKLKANVKGTADYKAIKNKIVTVKVTVK